MKPLVIGAILIGLTTSTALAAPATITGPAGVADGDTLRINGTRIRLIGIDAPESHQTCQRTDGEQWACGQEAGKRLQRLIKGRPVECRGEEKDRYGRLLAVCSVGGMDIGRWMVRSGWAVAYRHYSTAYVPDETVARKTRVGVWGSSFEMPWEWRHEH